MPRRFHFVFDLIATAIAIELAAWLTRTFLFPDAAIGWVDASVNSLGILIAAAFATYFLGLHQQSVLSSLRSVLVRSFWVGVLAAVGGLLATYFYWYLPSGRMALGLQVASVSLAVASWRLVAAVNRSRSVSTTTLLLGGGEDATVFARAVGANPYHKSFRFACVYDQPQDDSMYPPRLGNFDEAVEICRRQGISRAVLVQREALNLQQIRTVTQLRSSGVRVSTAEAHFIETSGRIPGSILRKDWVRAVFDHVDHRLRDDVKRVLDILVASLGLVVFGLLLPFLWIASKLDSPGPFFYSQSRVGLGGTEFEVFKIRTMRADPVDGSGSSSQQWAQQNDQRITRLGKFLRQTRIDEMPQFFNVLRGDMSIVGPRPEQPLLNEELQNQNPFFHYRYLVRPGITGWAQVNSGYASGLDASVLKLSYDLYYVLHCSLWLDLHIMLRTFYVMISRVNAR